MEATRKATGRYLQLWAAEQIGGAIEGEFNFIDRFGSSLSSQEEEAQEEEVQVTDDDLSVAVLSLILTADGSSSSCYPD